MNIQMIISGVGGQGVLLVTRIFSELALKEGFPMIGSEDHGMSQRGGSVTSDVRFGDAVLSPMVPPGEADYLLVLEPSQVDPNRHVLKSAGILITPEAIHPEKLPNKKSLNVALLGALSAHLPLSEADWLEALREAFPPEFFEPNRQAFLAGRDGQRQPGAQER